MKKGILFIFGFVSLLACNNAAKNNTATSETTSDSSNFALIENDKIWEQKDIMEFISEASNGGVAEIQLSQMAQKKASSKQVKDLGKLISTEHGDANEKLKEALKSMQLSAPVATTDNEYKDKIDDLQKKTGKEFDKNYVDYLVDDHEEDIEDFEKAQNYLPASELKTWVANTLPVLRKHLAEAKYIQKQLKNENSATGANNKQ